MGTYLIIVGLVRVLLLHSFMSQLATSFTTNLTDLSALLAFKSQIASISNDPRFSQWTANTSCCNWLGVSCGRRHQRVTALNLSYWDLQGTISPYVGNLSFLTVLDLGNNSFQGQLPESLGQLRHLRVINLRYNQLEGAIPTSLSHCQRLQSIILGSNYLQGSIPWEIGNLPRLEVLHLYENSLTSTIPLTIFNISTLREINFSGNKISGGIPTTICRNLPNLELLNLSFNPIGGSFPSSLCQCRSLRAISFVQNYFVGTIPRDIGCLSKLETLSLGRNQLTGIIPPSLGNLSRLARLDFIDNYLSGGIPLELGKLSRIGHLRIAFNNLSGRIPKVIFNLSLAEQISFMYNNLSGSVPEVTDSWLPNLKSLTLERNQLSGKIPIFVSNASKLTLIELSANFFSGRVPMTLGNLQFLETLNLQHNQLTNDPSQRELHFITTLSGCRRLKNLVIGPNPLNGALPNFVGNLSSSLELFSADASGIQGSLPVSIGNWSNILILELARNELRGRIPSTFGALRRLQRLQLYGNKIEGSIPNELCSSTFLGELYLQENKLLGKIPSCIGNLSGLQSVSLSSNELTLSIPLSLWSINNIWFLNLSLNSLSGYLPPEIQDLMTLETIDLSKNQLSESIPGTISNLKTLKILNLSDNFFQGSIPEDIGNLGSLESLDLSSNNLSGTIPKSLEKLQYLKNLNLSLNMLSGEVPTGGPFRNFTAQSFVGNEKLCGAPKLRLPACPTNAQPKSRKTMHWLKYILPPIAFVIVSAALLLIYVKCQVKRRHAPALVSLSDGTAHKLISYHELVRATNNFSEANLLGGGSFGSVYKGTMSDNSIVAVKVFHMQVEGALKSFDAECEVLRNVRHRNLVKIISSCSNLDFRALILEYMPNGSLEKVLHSHGQCLDLVHRLNIMIDAALAMEYLHHGYSEPIVHCDLKPSNVLLDEDMVAHVGDFGIAKILAKYKSMTQTATLGSMGYIAPEYGSEGRVSTKGDVYSYGIVLMEIFSRRKPTDEMFGEGWSLRQWVSCSFPHLVTDIVDANLLATGTTTEHLQHSLSSIMELALQCTTESPVERPNMKDVAAMLAKIKKQFLQASTLD